MRTMKFRAWDKAGGMWLKNGSYVCGEFMEIALAFCDIGPQGQRTLLYPSVEREKQIILMQFTGLLDKQGREIYEGDVMAIKGIDDDREYYYKVYQNKSGTWMACNELYSDIKDEDFERCQICGNIYENPKLIN